MEELGNYYKLGEGFSLTTLLASHNRWSGDDDYHNYFDGPDDDDMIMNMMITW